MKLTKTLIAFFLLVSVSFAGDIQFIRITKERDKPVSLDVPIMQYEYKDDVTVDLVGAVHIGDRGYYNYLNSKFESYDVVLYELVAPNGTVPKKKHQNDSLISFLQQLMKDAMYLSFQMECIDYDRDNFVHADLSLKDLKLKMASRGETPLTLFLGIFRDMLKNSQKKHEREFPDINFISLLLGDTREARKLKRFFANNLVDSADGSIGETLDQYIISDRNQACLQVLKKQIDKGHKKIGIFYGVAHFPDFHKKLTSDWNMNLVKVRWIKAWNLR